MTALPARVLLAGLVGNCLQFALGEIDQSARLEAADLVLKESAKRASRFSGPSSITKNSRFTLGGDGVIQLSEAPGLRLNVKGGELKNGDPLILWPCSPHIHELFEMTDDGFIRLVANKDLCLQAKGGLFIGNEIITYPCAQGGQARKHEQFYMTDDGRIRAKQQKDMCFNVRDAKLDSGGQLIIWWCQGGAKAVNEQFVYSNGMIMLKEDPELRLNVAGGDTQNHGQLLNLWHCQAHQHELFEFTEEGALRVQGRPDLCVNAEKGLQVGNRLVIWPCSESPGINERWAYNPEDSSIHSLEQPNVGFNAKGGNMQQGDEMVLWWLHQRDEL